MKLLLIRHGQSEGNAARRLQGQGEYPLSELGQEQARRLARRLAAEYEGIVAVYTSPQSRAAETAEILAQAVGAPVVADDRLKECAVGKLTGLTIEEVQARFPDFFAAWTQDIDEWVPMPGGEGSGSCRRRVCEAFDEIAARHGDGQTVAVVSHGGSLGAYLSDSMGIPPNRRYPFRFANASLSVVEVSGRFRLILHNDTCHIADIGGGR